jgi:hypothetical protein
MVTSTFSVSRFFVAISAMAWRRIEITSSPASGVERSLEMALRDCGDRPGEN